MFVQYLITGFKHVLPLGYDHVLFIVCLFFYNSRLKATLIQCTLFTLAHSLTLALAALGYVNLNLRIVESLIAFSIFLVAFENVFENKKQWQRLPLVFLFGLLHGLGFASALNETGLPKNEFISALLGFNLGVELAQILVVMGCFVVFAKWWRHKPWYHSYFVKPISLGIATLALFWSVQRFFA